MAAQTEYPPTHLTFDSDSEEAEEIRGMMPSFHVWHDAQHTIAVERALRLRALDARRAGAHRRWPWVVGMLAIAALAIGADSVHTDRAPVATATTPAGALAWRTVGAPSGGFRVSLPARPESIAVDSPAGTGEQLEARVNQTTVAVAVFANAGSQARALVEPIIQARANALDGYVDSIHTVGSRAGEAFEGTLFTNTPIALVRVIINGSTIYVIEMRGDIDSPRAQQIYDQVVLSFTPH